MQKKLTITIDEQIYQKLYSVIGSGKISKFIEGLVKPHLMTNELEKAYLAMGDDDTREQEAFEWIEGALNDQYSK
jgi:predicted CopG family antitoxin